MIYFRSISICSFMILIQTMQAFDQKLGFNYKVRFTGIERDIPSTRKDIINIKNIKLIKQQKVFMVNGTFTIYKDFPVGMKFSLFTTKRGTGATGFSPYPQLSFKDKDFCDIFHKNKFIIPFVLEHSTIPRECPPKKGTYEIYNITVGPYNLPSNLHLGEYNSTFQWTFKGEPYVTIGYKTEIEQA